MVTTFAKFQIAGQGHNIVMAFFLVLLILFTPQTHANSDIKENSTLHFTLRGEHGFPSKETVKSFDCLDRIYAVTELSYFKKGEYTIEFHWVDPDGNTRETTKYDFLMRKEPKTELWGWLELSRAKGAGMIQWLNPAAGLEEFIGFWTVELVLNGKTINKGQFEVLC